MKPNDKAIEAAILAIKENGPYYAGSKIRESYVMPAPNRLTPVDDEALVEMAAKRMCINDDDDEELIWSNAIRTQKEYYLTQARAAIAAIRPHIEAAERERCAKAGKAALLKSNYGELHADANYADELGEEIAAAIRSGK